jgi:hypothetical protein
MGPETCLAAVEKKPKLYSFRELNPDPPACRCIDWAVPINAGYEDFLIQFVSFWQNYHVKWSITTQNFRPFLLIQDTESVRQFSPFRLKHEPKSQVSLDNKMQTTTALLLYLAVESDSFTGIATLNSFGWLPKWLFILGVAEPYLTWRWSPWCR